MKMKVLLPILVLLVSTFATIEGQNKIEVTSLQANQLLQKDKKIIVIDARTSDEFNEGHIKGAKNIDIRQADAFNQIDKLNKDAKYLVYCRTNHRSGIAVQHMMQNGFKVVYQIMDGFPGWAANNLPFVK